MSEESLPVSQSYPATVSPAPTPEELIQGGAKKERLGAWYATAICGNDITSSCLYVSAIAIVYAHALAPVALLLAAGDIHQNLGIIRELHPDLKIEYQARKGQFNPATVDALSQELDIPHNMMFMGSLTYAQSFSIQDLGGVRIIW